MISKLTYKILPYFIAFLLFGNISFFSQNFDNKNFIRPHLGSHAFVLNNSIVSPFINTFYSNTLGYGQSLNLNVPIIIIGGEPLTGLRGDVSFLNVDFGFQNRVNSWTAIFIKAGVVARFGSETQSIVAEGLNTTISAEIGWIFKVYETRNTILSFKTSLLNKSGTYLNLFKFVKEIVDSGGITEDNHLVYSGSFLQGTGALLFGWSINKYFGFVTNLQVGYGESIDEISSTSLYYRATFSLDYDLSSAFPNIPLGFAIGYISDSFSDSDDISVKGSTNAIYYHIAYVERKDLLLGVDIQDTLFPFISTTEDLKTVNASFNIKYYFN